MTTDREQAKEPDWSAAGFSKPPVRSEQWWKHEVSNAWAEGYERGRLQREWQGLTDKEHEQIAIDCGCASADWVFYGAAVERKLKEKNHG